jgi:sugar phosphate isomerase/epimerase
MKYGICVGAGHYEIAARSGFGYVESSAAAMRALTPEALREARAKADAVGITVDGYNGYFDGSVSLYNDSLERITEYARGNVAVAQVLGGRYFVFGSGGPRSVPQGMERERATERLLQVADVLGAEAAAIGADIYVEPLRYAESNILNTLKETVLFCRTLGRANVRPLVDVFHFYMNGEELDDFALLQPGELGHVHIARPNADRAAPDPADVDALRPYAEAIKRTGYCGRVSLECSWAKGLTDDSAKAAVAAIAAAFD